MAKCMVAGCPDDAVNKLGLRLRKPGVRRAVWAPDVDALLCKKHAEEGGEFVIDFRPAIAQGKVNISVTSSGAPVTHRQITVKKSAA